jgi:hypothetical protein
LGIVFGCFRAFISHILILDTLIWILKRYLMIFFLVVLDWGTFMSLQDSPGVIVLMDRPRWDWPLF